MTSANYLHADTEWVKELVAIHGPTAPGLPTEPAGPVLASAQRLNPTCGDAVDLSLASVDGKVQISGTATGCMLSVTAASLLAAALAETTPADARELLSPLIDHRMRGTGPSDDAARCIPDSEAFADLLQLAVVEIAPLRRRCVALSWQVAAELLASVNP